MAKFNEYPVKATPEDADALMLYDAATKSNKLSPFSGIWNWIVEKLTNAVISNLQTNSKTVLGAINELNSKSLPSNGFSVKNIRYTDSEVEEMGGLNNCVIDALNNTIPKDVGFFGTFTANIRYLMIGYRYTEGKYGTVILFDFSNNTLRWNIRNGEITKA